MEEKEFFGYISLFLALIGYVPYVRDLLSRKTKPHAFSWLVWSVLAVIGFGIQIEGGAGSGSWLLGLTAVATLLIFFLSLKYGYKDFALTDKISLVVSFLAILVWIRQDQPVIAAIMVSAIEAIGGFYPTLRKSIINPFEETIVNYLVYSVSIIFSLLALHSFALENIIYPVAALVMNVGLAGFLIFWRKKKS